jgi:hypothetical protein
MQVHFHKTSLSVSSVPHLCDALPLNVSACCDTFNNWVVARVKHPRPLVGER